ncbi:MAG: PAS domain S-box protein [Polaribacter sp.]
MNSIKKPTYEALQNLVDKLKVDAKVKNNKALLKSDVLYQDLLNSSKDLIVVVNKNGKIEFINHASKKFYGLSPGKCLGKIVFDFVHPEDQEKIKAKFIKWQHLKKNRFHFENRQMSSSGEIRETEWNVNIERNEKEIIKITSIIRDITIQNATHLELLKVNKELLTQNKLQEKQTQSLISSKQDAEESEARFRMLILSMEAGVLVHGPDTSIITSNIRASEILGLSDDQLRGLKTISPIWKFVKADKSPLPVSDYPVNRIARTKKSIKNSIVGVVHPDRNTITWAKVNGCASLSDTGEIKEIVISFIEYTDRVKIEQEKIAAILKLEKSEKRLNHTQELASVGSWVFHPPTQKAEWSDETFNLWGLDSRKGLPTFETLIQRVHKEDLELFTSTYKAAVEFGVPYDVEVRVNLPNGIQKTLRSICKTTLGSSGEVVSLTGANIDFTAQKLLEKDQIKHQRIKAIGEMSSSIAHDFNNSLQQISGNLEVIKLQKNLSSKSADRLNNISGIIADAASRVDALQKFGDSENDAKKIEQIDFNVLIEESLDQSRPLWKDGMEKKGLRFRMITDFKDIPKFEGHKGVLKSAIHNLIKNSIEAMPKGGDIKITTSCRGKQVFATFTDTGFGMDEKTKIKVFEPFFSTKGFKLGRGLGMSGVYNTIKEYKGDITVKTSKPNEGTTFEISFPAIHKEEAKETIETKPQEKEVFNILWVDDDVMITKDVCELIELMGHTCTIANSGKTALAHLHENRYDLVFTDIGMPEMNGWEFIKKVRNDFSKDIKIITVSGWSIDAKVKKEHGIDVVLQKPFTVEKLENLFSALYV